MNRELHNTHQQLVAACINGDHKAYGELYNAFSKGMYNICLRMMGNAEDAKDMLQEGFVDAFRKIGSFRNESTFGAWLKRIIVNRCINELEKRRIEWVFANEDYTHQLPDTNDAPDEEKLMLSVERVKRAMNELPEGARVIFSLYLIEGYDHTEIAEILSISESTSKTQFMRARQMVKEKLLAKPGFEC